MFHIFFFRLGQGSVWLLAFLMVFGISTSSFALGGYTLQHYSSEPFGVPVGIFLLVLSAYCAIGGFFMIEEIESWEPRYRRRYRRSRRAFS